MNKIKLEKKERNKQKKEWREKVLTKFNHICAIPKCGVYKQINAHHIIPREFKETRYEPENGIALCPTHHSFGRFSAHKNAVWFVEFLRINFPSTFKYVINKLKELDNE